MAEAEGTVHVRTAWEADHGKGGSVLVTVSDDGPGTGDLTIDRMCEPFFTTHPGRLGMGLTLCRTLVEAQGSALTVSPSSSSFAIRLPAQQAD